MKRLYDRIIRTPAADLYTDLAWLHQLLPGAQQFEIGNVARYYFSETDQEDWRPSRDLPNLAPQYPRMWFEYQIPDLVRSDVHGVVDNSANTGRHGILVVATDLESGEVHNLVVQPPVNTRWILTIAGYTSITRLDGQPVDVTLAAQMVAILYIDAAGRTLVEARPEGDMIEFAFSRSAPTDDESRKSLWGACVPALLAISLLHCKNVVITDHQPPAVRKRRDRYGAQQRHEFKTLHVTPMRTVTKRAPAADSGDQAGARFHHKRGHFKTYTEEAPLFGRWTGTWWWSDQTVGDMSLGSIGKLYSVDPA